MGVQFINSSKLDGRIQVEDKTQPHPAGSRRASKRSGPPAFAGESRGTGKVSHLVSPHTIVSLKAVLGEMASQSKVSAKGDAVGVKFCPTGLVDWKDACHGE
jgi:hypothetical protein